MSSCDSRMLLGHAVKVSASVHTLCWTVDTSGTEHNRGATGGLLVRLGPPRVIPSVLSGSTREKVGPPNGTHLLTCGSATF